MALTDDQISTVRRMVGDGHIYSFSDIQARANALNTAEQGDLVDLATQWTTAEPKNLDIDGGKDGVRLISDKQRLKLRTLARGILGLPPAAESDYATNGRAIQVGFIRGVDWRG